ncbi:OmpA family protein [Oscillatoria salina]|uniref:OmpA family protein n=1 Tax=Oscillatoria salina TaxID=331517 RepID=UPI0013B61F73|nr:OmpA family protein [Oscillatoria salina]MBZ8182572.1 OmpA family protein [Oscillatoria salina IIICB1]NET88291.1 OmpA family protein [Kamptonema sp. SIO1D9]
MTQSINSTSENTESKKKRDRPWLLIFFWRLFLLGIGGTLAIAIGILIGFFAPAENAQKPWIIKLWENIQGVTTNFDDTSENLPQLTAPEQTQLQNDLQVLETELNELRDRTNQLETQYGIQPGDRPVESRIRTLTQLSQANNVEGLESSETEQTSLPAEKVKVTLPTDLLFPDNSTIISTEASKILDNVVSDLRQYQGATIRIAAHSDTTPEPEKSRERSFQRAKAVEEYLRNALGDNYRFSAIGFGETRPLVANDSDINRQRNRRIEIAVD